jgi:hypothetical protein
MPGEHPYCFRSISLDIPFEPSSGPFGRRLLADPVYPGSDLNTADPLPGSSPTIPVRLRSPLPLRGFRPVRITLFDPIYCRELAFRNGPISLALHAPSCGSWLQVRYRFGGWLFLKPPGSSSIFLPQAAEGIQILQSLKCSQKSHFDLMKAKLFALSDNATEM